MKTILGFAALVLLAIAGAACGGGDPVVVEKEVIREVEVTAAVPEPVVLRMAVGDPTASGGALIFPYLANQIERRTNGQVKVEIFWGGALFGALEILEGIQSGAADMGTPYTAYAPDKMPLSLGVLGSVIPFSDGNTEALVTRVRKVLETIPAAKEEFASFNQIPIAVYALAPYHLPTNKKLTTLKAWKGAKIGTPGTSAPKMVKAAGGVPVSIPAGEMYEAMQRGIIDGRVLSRDATIKFKLHEVSEYFLLADFGHLAGVGIITINKDVFDGFSPDIQKAILEAGKASDYQGVLLVSKSEADADKIFTEIGVQTITLDPTDREKWKNMPEVQAIPGDWAADMDAKGLPGNEILRIITTGQ